jgi:hypothetical protein
MATKNLYEMTEKQIEKAVNEELDRMNRSYINYQTSFLKDGMTPLTFIEWVRVQNEKIQY